jgi:hypothetical protein
MAILNYTTQINENKSVGEIQTILARQGAKQIAVDYENGFPSALNFEIVFNEESIFFRLPCNVDGVYKSLCATKGVPSAKQTREQARRVAWRIVKDWVEAQLAIVESRQAEMTEVFLPYALDNKGKTFFESFTESRKLLTAG